MNMRAKFFGAIAGGIVFLSVASNAKAQCPTTMVISQAPIGQECGANVSYEVSNPNGFQFIQFDLDGTPISTQQSGSIYLNPGTYTFAVSTADANNCTMYIEEEITILPSVTVQFQNNTVACNGMLGLNVSVQGGSGNYTYAWEPSALMNNPTASAPAMNVGTSSEVVSVTVTDNLGCSQFAEMVVYPNLPVNQTLELCSGSATLSLDPGSLMYNWSATDVNGDAIDMTGVTGNVFDATTPGTYVVVTYYMGCNVTTHQFIVEECTSTACPTIMAVNQVPSGCGADVSFAVNNPNGFQFVQFTLDGTPISTQSSGSTYLNPGTYVIASSTADANNCTMYLEEEITVLPANGLSAFISVQATPCAGVCTGQLMAGANGGTFPYSYNWNIATTTQVVTHACMDFYEVTVTDANGCTSVASVDLVDAGPIINFFSDTVACNGTLMLDNSTSGGSGDYSFSWTPASMMSDPFAEFPIMTVGTEITLVSVTVTDNVTGCFTTETVLVYPNLPIQSTVSLCNNSTELMVNPGSIAYNWSATDPDGNTIDMTGVSGNSFEATVPGNYVVVTYYAGCNVTTHLFEVGESNLTVGFSIILGGPEYACNGECINVGAVGFGGTAPYSVEWSDGTLGSALEACTGGEYSAVLVDALGCVSDASILIPGCPGACSSSFTYTQQCGMFCFNGAGSPAAVAYYWDFGDGNTSNSAEPDMCHTYPVSGTFDVTLQTIDATGCVSSFSVPVVYDALVVSVEDTVYTCAGVCAGTATAIASGGSAPFTYFWSDGSNQEFTSGLCAGNYLVMVTDTNGCSVTEYVVVLEHPVQELTITDSSYMVMNDVGIGWCFIASVGFDSYLWNTGSATQVICTVFTPDNSQQWGDILLMAMDSNGCYYETSIPAPVPIWGEDVWPGDVDFDGIANNVDLIYLGYAYGFTDSERPMATLDWEAQPSPDWNWDFFYLPQTVNFKHADTDGNGTVNFADTIAISQNYSLTHGKTENALGGGYPMLRVEATPDTVGLLQAVNITVHLADAAMPVDSLHGIAFTLTFNETLVIADDLAIDFSNNTLGTVGSDVLTLQKPLFPNGEIDVAITRNTLQNFSGFGPLMTARIVTTDNLSGVHELRIGISGVTAITATEAPVLFTTVADTVFVDSERVGINEQSSLDFRVYPNPSQGVFQLEDLAGNVNVEVMDATGRVVEQLQNNGNGKLTVDMSHQTAGMYVMRVWNETGFAVKRIELLGH